MRQFAGTSVQASSAVFQSKRVMEMKDLPTFSEKVKKLLTTGYSQDADLNRIVGQIQSVYSVDLDSDITYILYETHMSIPPLSFYYGVKYLLQ